MGVGWGGSHQLVISFWKEVQIFVEKCDQRCLGPILRQNLVTSFMDDLYLSAESLEAVKHALCTYVAVL